MCVSVYVAEPEGSQPWSFFARHRAHYKKIQGRLTYCSKDELNVHVFATCLDIMFGVKLDSKAPRLLSLSSDRTIVSASICSLCCSV